MKGSRDPEGPGPPPDQRRSPEMTTLTFTTRYARYLLTSLATVAFGVFMN
jgi:hypothetical protein